MNSLVILSLLVPIIAAILVIINYALAPHRPIFNKKGTYECGLLSRTSQTRQPFSVLFYIVSAIFLLFDLELVLFWPLSQVLNLTGIYGFWTGAIFFVVLTVGFVIELAAGVLNFSGENSL